MALQGRWDSRWVLEAPQNLCWEKHGSILNHGGYSQRFEGKKDRMSKGMKVLVEKVFTVMSGSGRLVLAVEGG